MLAMQQLLEPEIMVCMKWENFITALAYLFCLALPGSCLAMFYIPLFRVL